MADFREKLHKFLDGSPLESTIPIDQVGGLCPGPGSENIYMKGFMDRTFTFFDGIKIDFDYCEPEIAALNGIECVSPTEQMIFMNTIQMTL